MFHVQTLKKKMLTLLLSLSFQELAFETDLYKLKVTKEKKGKKNRVKKEQLERERRRMRRREKGQRGGRSYPVFSLNVHPYFHSSPSSDSTSP